MDIFWVLLFSSNPAFFLLGISGVFGDEAQQVAKDLAVVFALLGLVLIIAVIIGVL